MHNGAADKPPAGDPHSGTEAGRLHPHDGAARSGPSAGGHPLRHRPHSAAAFHQISTKGDSEPEHPFVGAGTLNNK